MWNCIKWLIIWTGNLSHPARDLVSPDVEIRCNLPSSNYPTVVIEWESDRWQWLTLNISEANYTPVYLKGGVFTWLSRVNKWNNTTSGLHTELSATRSSARRERCYHRHRYVLYADSTLATTMRQRSMWRLFEARSTLVTDVYRNSSQKVNYHGTW